MIRYNNISFKRTKSHSLNFVFNGQSLSDILTFLRLRLLQFWHIHQTYFLTLVQTCSQNISEVNIFPNIASDIFSEHEFTHKNL